MGLFKNSYTSCSSPEMTARIERERLAMGGADAFRFILDYEGPGELDPENKANVAGLMLRWSGGHQVRSQTQQVEALRSALKAVLPIVAQQAQNESMADILPPRQSSRAMRDLLANLQRLVG